MKAQIALEVQKQVPVQIEEQLVRDHLEMPLESHVKAGEEQLVWLNAATSNVCVACIVSMPSRLFDPAPSLSERPGLKMPRSYRIRQIGPPRLRGSSGGTIRRAKFGQRTWPL